MGNAAGRGEQKDVIERGVCENSRGRGWWHFVAATIFLVSPPLLSDGLYDFIYFGLYFKSGLTLIRVFLT